MLRGMKWSTSNGLCYQHRLRSEWSDSWLHKETPTKQVESLHLGIQKIWPAVKPQGCFSYTCQLDKCNFLLLRQDKDCPPFPMHLMSEAKDVQVHLTPVTVWKEHCKCHTWSCSDNLPAQRQRKALLLSWQQTASPAQLSTSKLHDCGDSKSSWVMDEWMQLNFCPMGALIKCAGSSSLHRWQGYRRMGL